MYRRYKYGPVHAFNCALFLLYIKYFLYENFNLLAT